MSFYSYKNANPNCCPGTISGSALDGLQEKVCVQVKRVYDSAMTQEQLTKQTVTITSYAQVNNTCTCNACGCQETQDHPADVRTRAADYLRELPQHHDRGQHPQPDR